MVAAQCLEGLAKGLMGSFARYRETVVHPMLERLKERKATVTDTIGVALDAIFETVSEAVHARVPSFFECHRRLHLQTFLAIYFPRCPIRTLK